MSVCWSVHLFGQHLVQTFMLLRGWIILMLTLLGLTEISQQISHFALITGLISVFCKHCVEGVFSMDFWTQSCLLHPFVSPCQCINISSPSMRLWIVSEKGEVFVWGYGILGKGPKLSESSTPEMIPSTLFGLSEFNPSVAVTRIRCGLNHFAAVTGKNVCFVFLYQNEKTFLKPKAALGQISSHWETGLLMRLQLSNINIILLSLFVSSDEMETKNP